MKPRKTPMRKCTGCGQSKDKRELIRIVRDPQGVCSVDKTGRKSGRGAYICPNEACLVKAIRTKALERSLACEISEEVFETLKKELANDE
ncbi:MAG: YlxR family protein [Firmicutes bacterium]|nr:YlxR family protein [Bacillota bacterium]